MNEQMWPIKEELAEKDAELERLKRINVDLVYKHTFQKKQAEIEVAEGTKWTI